MISWRDLTTVKAHREDLLREAEKERLIQQMTAGQETEGSWQKVKGFLAGVSKKKQVSEEEVVLKEQQSY